ncbi:DUF4389 domain-containing protein [Amycolatopsis azurea]|uniref:Putative transmembrane protein n=1 Tax=Amycolatopsis azurea DSM 43854 TaxID=1238180 RepID=M2NTC4_9PSEU|nr:DUF4389 domain-containing protein [Amycolatopsis azurea]EMD25664.1 putative transmembrane protein [Amycolatopsis azurea DSM 43854]OOC02552.1 hypothetical protein B0293_30790 [Amycolatopsis azurea DSM 43854]
MNQAVRVEARLDPGLSRWLWLVKWLLAIPHYAVLAFLWPAFVLLTVFAFFAILATGRYPRAIFEFNVGVLRWSWRVHYYAYAALGTDRYPPFTLADVPEYPARLEIVYPERLSRGLVLVKWWLLAIPHYIVVGLFAGGGLWLAWRSGDDGFSWGAGGLIGLLVLIAGFVLLFTGEYPKPIYDFVLGMDRWVVRVGAYAALMTDEYPPFRLDTGGAEPDYPTGEGVPPARKPGESGWTPGRIVAVVVGIVLGLTSMGLLTGGATALWLDRVARDSDGYLTTAASYRTETFALASERIRFARAADDSVPALGALGDLRVTVTDDVTRKPVFIGIARSQDVQRYLAGTAYATVTDLSSGAVVTHQGPDSPGPPETRDIWKVKSSGPGSRAASWPDEPGDWTVVVMNADGSPDVQVRSETGATVPALGWFAWSLLLIGAAALAGAVALVAFAVAKASQGISTAGQGER